MNEAKKKIIDVASEFRNTFKTETYGLYEEYKTDDADEIFVSMGSICGPIKDVVDVLRNNREKVGL